MGCATLGLQALRLQAATHHILALVEEDVGRLGLPGEDRTQHHLQGAGAGGRREKGGLTSYLNLVLIHRGDAVIIKVVPLAAVLVAGKCSVWKEQELSSSARPPAPRAVGIHTHTHPSNLASPTI